MSACGVESALIAKASLATAIVISPPNATLLWGNAAEEQQAVRITPIARLDRPVLRGNAAEEQQAARITPIARLDRPVLRENAREGQRTARAMPIARKGRPAKSANVRAPQAIRVSHHRPASRRLVERRWFVVRCLGSKGRAGLRPIVRADTRRSVFPTKIALPGCIVRGKHARSYRFVETIELAQQGFAVMEKTVSQMGLEVAMIRLFVWVGCLFVGTYFLMLPVVWAEEDSKACSRLFQQKEALRAGDCFAQLAEKMPASAQLDALQKRQKGLYLQYAAKAYVAHTKEEPLAQKQSYFYEKAVLLLRRYLDEKLCLQAYQCRSIQGLLYEYEKRIGYATLVLLDDSPTSPQVELSGYRVERRFLLNKKHTEKLRPGTYTLRVLYGGAAPIERVILLKRETDHAERFSSPSQGPPKTAVGSAPWAAWLVFGVGAASLAGGIVLLGASLSMDGDVGAKLENAGDLTVTQSREIGNTYATARGLNTGGWVAVGVGAAVAVGGILWVVLAPKGPKASGVAQKQRSFEMERAKTSDSSILFP